MPTGYTYVIDDDPDNATAREFLLRCVRCTGAAAGQRDEPLSASLRIEQEPSAHYVESVTRAEERLAKFEALDTIEKIGAAFKERCEEIKELNKKRRQECEKAREAYLRIKQEILEWDPPPEFAFLRGFALEQLEVGRPSQYRDIPVPEHFRPWYQQELRSALISLGQAKEQLEKAQLRCERNTKFLKDFVEALP